MIFLVFINHKVQVMVNFNGHLQVNVPGMVDTFKTKYEGLQIPYPSDGGALKGEKK